MADAQPRRNSDATKGRTETHPYIEEARAQIAPEFGRQLAACDRLRDYAIDLLAPWKGRPLDPEKHSESILAAIFARSLNTYWAAVELARIGFGEQAMMLNRSLFEDMVDAHWVSIQPSLAVKRYEQHHEHNKMLLADSLEAYPSFFPPGELPRFSDEERAPLDAVFGPFGSRSWTGLNMHDRVAAIEYLWRSEDGKETLRFFRDIVHRENNQMLHVSARSLGEMVRARGREGITFKLGPGGEFLDRALFGSFWIFIQTLTLILETLEFPRDRDAEAEVFSEASFRKPTAEQLKDVGRNDPCPCGSGKKFKRCHGTRA